MMIVHHILVGMLTLLVTSFQLDFCKAQFGWGMACAAAFGGYCAMENTDVRDRVQKWTKKLKRSRKQRHYRKIDQKKNQSPWVGRHKDSTIEEGAPPGETTAFHRRREMEELEKNSPWFVADSKEDGRVEDKWLSLEDDAVIDLD